MTMELLSEHACFGGVQGYYRHTSEATRLPMRFSLYQPPQARSGPVPVLFFLAGLTATDETFAIKAGAQRVAAELGLMLVSSDTSPRNTGLEGATRPIVGQALAPAVVGAVIGATLPAAGGYVIAAALRLAKFNVTTASVGTRFFLGLPSTSSGGMLASAFLQTRSGAGPPCGPGPG